MLWGIRSFTKGVSVIPLESMFQGKTFDDFLLRPRHSVLTSRRFVELAMPLTGSISLNLPIVGANMDTVTGKEMAKALALEGAMGFLHRNCAIEMQAGWVKAVKSTHAYIIENPVVLPKSASLRKALELIRQHGVSGILIEREPGSRILDGVLSNRDIPRDVNDRNLDMPVGELMTPLDKLAIGRPGISLEHAKKTLFQIKKEKLPLVGPDGKIAGLITMRDLRMSEQKPYSNKDAKGRLVVGATIGATGDFMERAQALITVQADCILMDVAFADSIVVEKGLKKFRAKFKDVPLVCGNVGTGEGAKFLADLGADAIKVGIGPGRGCRTRLETGFGVAQLQAIREAWCTTSGKVPIIADGGVKYDKDIFLAIACGATTVMLGSMLSGTDEAPGIIIDDPATRQKMKLYRGMTSPEAVADGVQGEELQEALRTPAEGQSVKVPYVGTVVDTLARIRGHLQSSVSYAGCGTLREAHERISSQPARYLTPITPATQRESWER